MSELYFAYGSNLKASRMLERVPSAQPHGAAALHGMRVAFDKASRDGSGKANLRPDPGACTWGFVYRIGVADWLLLDRFEPGYSRMAIDLVDRSGTALRAHTYLADEPREGLIAFDWYRALIVEGACEHGLPDAHIELLRALPVRVGRRST